VPLIPARVRATAKPLGTSADGSGISHDQVGSPLKQSSRRQALLVVAHLRKGEANADLAVCSRCGTRTVGPAPW
jgi:hypothetical protein